jgi:hypothetical protein
MDKPLTEWTIEELLNDMWFVIMSIADSRDGSDLELLHEGYILVRQEIIRRANNAEV